MSHMRDHNEWFDRVTGNASGRSAGAAAGIAIATLNRQLSKGELSAEFVIAIARAYVVNPVAALVQTGYLQPGEAGSITAAELAEILSDQDIIRILAYRIDKNPSAWEGTFDEVVEEAQEEDKVVQLNGSNKSTPDVQSLRYVADDSDDEPEMGDDGYHDGP